MNEVRTAIVRYVVQVRVLEKLRPHESIIICPKVLGEVILDVWHYMQDIYRDDN